MSMTRKGGPRRVRPIRPRRKKDTGNVSAWPSGRNIAFRFSRFVRASVELADELIGAVLRKVRLERASDGYRRLPPEPPVDELEQRAASPWGSLAGWGVLIAAPVCLYYFCGPVHRVAYTAYTTVYRAVELELAAPQPQETNLELMRRIESSVTTILPQEERGAVLAPMLEWLRLTHRDLGLKSRIDELEMLDDMIVREVRCVLFAKAQRLHGRFGAGRSPLRVRAACRAGKPGNPWLVLAVGRGGAGPDGITFAVRFVADYDDYDYFIVSGGARSLRDPIDLLSGEPSLKTADLDGDGSAEIIESWVTGSDRELTVRVHKLVAGDEWRTVLSATRASMGQVKVVRRGAAAELVIANGIARSSGGPGPRRVVYLISVYSWDAKQGALRKTREYLSDQHSVLIQACWGGQE